MTPRLATVDGSRVTPVWNGPRYVSAGGDIRDQTQPSLRITLAQAEEGVSLYRFAIADEPNERIVNLYARWAMELLLATDECRTQRRQRGWSDPYAVDKPFGAIA